MMNRISLLILVSLIMTGCPNSFEIPERVIVKINLTGLDFQSEANDTLKSAASDIFSQFKHNYAHTDLYFYREGANYNISTGSIGQGISTSLSVGTYHVEGYGGWASPLGTGELTCVVPGQEIVVESGSSNIDLHADLDCALILVADLHNQLDKAFITGEGNPETVFSRVDDFWYSYFSPQIGFQIHLMKKGGEEVVIDTNDLTTGRLYKFEVLMD